MDKSVSRGQLLRAVACAAINVKPPEQTETKEASTDDSSGKWTLKNKNIHMCVQVAHLSSQYGDGIKKKYCCNNKTTATQEQEKKK